MKEPKSLKGPKTTVTWHYLLDLPLEEYDELGVRLGTFFDIQNRLLLLSSKIQTGYWFFHHIKNRLLVWSYVSKQVPVIDNSGVQLSVVQVVWTIQNHVTIYDLIANTRCLAKKQKQLLACVQKMKPVIGFKQPC